MAAKAICGSCHASVEGYGSPRKNSKGQYLVNIRPHWKSGEIGGMMCNARIGVVAK